VVHSISQAFTNTALHLKTTTNY